MLTDNGRTAVEAAIREAERGTSGEIVVVVTRSASRYRSLPYLYALAAALLVPWPLIAWTQLGIGVICLVQLALTALVWLAARPLAVRLALAPSRLKRARAREAAEREFINHGMADTRGRTGVLLYVADAERHAEVIGDIAISGQVGEAEWRAIIEVLVEAFRRGEHAEGLSAAIASIGHVLARCAPVQDGDVDELPNRLVIL